LERRARVLAFVGAIPNVAWLVRIAVWVFAGPSLRDGAGFTLVVLGGLNACACYALARRAIIFRSQERLSKSWKDRINPWNVSLLVNGLWGGLALVSRPQHLGAALLAGAAILLAFAGRAFDGRPYR
jgi:hypothetical protein